VPPVPTPAPTPPPLEGLKDIVTPAPVSWWPPAPGWYAVAAVVLLALGWMFWRFVRRRRANAYRREALAELDVIAARLKTDATRAAAAGEIPALVRRVALCAAPREAVVAPVGAPWLAFLDRMDGGGGFSKGAGRRLPDLAYAAPAAVAAIPESELVDLVAVCRRWIARHRRGTPSP
jgi:hypothetical protein